MNYKTKYLVVSLLVAVPLIFLWSYWVGNGHILRNYPHVHSNLATVVLKETQPPDSTEKAGGALAVNPASREFREAYLTLARSTPLPAASVDRSGRALPKEFLDYLANESAGYDRIVIGLSSEGVAALTAMKRAGSALGVNELLDIVAREGNVAKPSGFDFIIYSNLKDQVREYPVHIQGAAQSQITRNWNTLAQSLNPVFRLLAINEAKRVIKDQTARHALLDLRTGEVDPIILHALIEQFVLMGGDAAKASLAQIASNSSARGDVVALKAAEEAIAAMK